MSILSPLRLKRFTDSLSRTLSIYLDLFKALYCCLQDLLLTLGRDLNLTGRKRGAIQPKLTSVVAVLGQHTVGVPGWLVLLADEIPRGEAIENFVGSAFLAQSFAIICAAGQGVAKGTIRELDCDGSESQDS
jgi:hypothetical protein